MNFNESIEIIQKMNGNYCRRTDDLYVLPTNIEKPPVLLDGCDDVQSILITPLL